MATDSTLLTTKRTGPRPRTTPANPHTQLDQNAPPDLQDVLNTAIANGWAEHHPLAGKRGLPSNIVMVYGPRDAGELAVVSDLVRASHAFAAT